MGWIITALALIAVILILFLLNFYRDPKRKIPEGSSIVAPADGRIISIISTSKKEIRINKGLFGKIKTLARDVAEECYVISIFMSPFDVHINRAPIQGTVKSVKYTKGKFFKAYDLEKSMENEKNEVTIQNRHMKVKIIQVAGFLARRIRCHVKKNQKVHKGQKIGMIALSSQTTVIIPKIIQDGMKLKIRVNDRVKAGETVIAG